MNRKKLVQIFVCVLGLAALPMLAMAATDLNRSVVALGVQGGGTFAVAYFSAAEGFSVAGCGLIYIDVNNNFGKSAYAEILMAKASGKKLSRVDYMQDGSGTCYLSLVEVQN